MTNEELDKARAEEAVRLWLLMPGGPDVLGQIAARLAREGWTPPPDSDVLLVREMLAARFDAVCCRREAQETRNGERDDTLAFQAALRVYRDHVAAKKETAE